MTKSNYAPAILLTTISLGFIASSIAIFESLETFTIGGWGFVWPGVLVLLSSLWVREDALARGAVNPSNAFFAALLLWPAYFPIYLFTTRSWDGLLMLLGFFSLLGGPWLASLVFYTFYI